MCTHRDVHTQRHAHRDMQRCAHTEMCTERHAHRGNSSVFKFRETETEKYMPSPGSKDSMTVEDQKYEPVDQRTESWNLTLVL